MAFARSILISYLLDDENPYNFIITTLRAALKIQSNSNGFFLLTHFNIGRDLIHTLHTLNMNF